MTSLARYRDIVDDFDAFEDICSTPLPRTIWHNRESCSSETFRDWIGGQLTPLTWCEDAYHIREIDRLRYYSAYLAGLFHVQEEASLIPVTLLNPQSGWTVLDLCAAPGNKTAQTAIQVGEMGFVVANDINKSRSGVIQTTLDRLSLCNVVITNSDAGFFPDAGLLFDAVLADVPCSCEGTTRKHKGVLLRTDQKYRDKLVIRQRRILERALLLCKPGGYVVYSTCTYAPEENEGVVSHVLNHSDAGRGVEIMPAISPGLNSVPGLTEWNGISYHKDIGRTLRIWPHLQDSGGFYAAILMKPIQNEAGSRPESTRTSESLKPTPELDDSVFSRSDCLPTDADWFGINGALREKFACLNLSNKYQFVVNSHLRIPEIPSIVSAGVRGVNTRGSTPRISTAGAQLLGKYATKQKVDLDFDDAVDYMTDKTVLLTDLKEVLLGRVIVTVKNVPVGLGTVNLADDTTGTLALNSLFPKSFGGIDVRTVLQESTV